MLSLLKATRTVMRPPFSGRMWQWAEDNITIPKESGSPWPGPYRTAPTPWVRGWFDALQDPSIQVIPIIKGSQVSATNTGYCWNLFNIAEDPDPSLNVMSARDDAKLSSTVRLQPMIRACPPCAEQIPDNPHDFSALEYKMRSMLLRWIGANSPGKAAAFAYRFLYIDEGDKFKETLGKEGSTMGLLFKRAKLFWNRKIYMPCTPTTKGGFIYRYWNRGDKRKFMCKCPKCGHRQPLEWKHIRFDIGKRKRSTIDGMEQADIRKLDIDDVAARAFIECQNRKCRYRIMDEHKNDMVTGGEWRPTCKAKWKNYASFSLGGIYSPSDEADIRAMTEEYLNIRRYGTMSDLQDFINGTVGDFYEEPPKKSISKAKIWSRQKAHVYERGIIPTKEPSIISMETDIQSAHLVYEVWAMQLYRHYMIDHGFLATLEDIDAIMENIYYDLNNDPYQIQKCFLDTGYDTMKAYAYALSRPNMVIIKGEKGIKTHQTKPVMPSEINSYPGGKMFGGNRKMYLLHCHPSYFKDQMSNAIDGKSDVEVFFHKGIDDDFVTQMCNEVLFESDPDKQGHTTLYWKKQGPNDFFDCGQYSFMARHLAHQQLLQIQKAVERGETSGKKSKGRKRSGKAPAKKKKRKRLEAYVDPGSVTL